MKIFLLAFFSILILHLSAQKNEKIIGIFRTSTDCINRNLSFFNGCNTEINRIRLNDFFAKPYITVKQKDSSYKFYKADIYGFEKCNKQIYRFTKKKELLMLNREESIVIYYNFVPRHSVGRTNVTNYYFSIGIDGTVQNLTIKNLKEAFTDNTKFQELIDKNFKYNTDLAAFDNDAKMYKINLLLKQSMELAHQ